jgi:hypothetical protein
MDACYRDHADDWVRLRKPALDARNNTCLAEDRGHRQVPARQVCPVVQAFPQLPQFATSRVVSMQRPSQIW